MAETPRPSPLLEAAKSLAPLIEQHVVQGERERRLPQPTLQALAKAGLLKMGRPREFGGSEADPLTIISVVEEVARADGSAGWCAMIAGVGSTLESFLPPEALREIITSPTTVTGGVLGPSGKATEVEGGYRISGRWRMASGCQHCDWLHAACLVFDGGAPRMGSNGRPDWIVPYVPASEAKILDTWHVAGLCGTGSHDFEMNDVFVPKHRTLKIPPVKQAYDDPKYAFPVFSLFPMSVATVALGVARRAVDEFVKLAPAKIPFGMRTPLATRANAQAAAGEAETTLQAARAFLIDAATQLWQTASAGKPLTLDQRLRLRMAVTNAGLGAARAVDLVYTAAGSSSLYMDSPIQRCFRDVHAITQNFVVAPPTYELFGQIMLGIEADTMLL